MIKMVALLSLFASVAGSANAETYNTVGTVIDVQPEYAQVTTSVPTETCRNVQSGGNVGDTIAGAIIGGAIGNQFGGGSGKDAATVLGAIIGADVANQPRTRLQCETVYSNSYTNELVGYVVTYELLGFHGVAYSHSNYRIGDHKPVRVTIEPR
jgi:uncharacterized protein YcfJ